MFLLIFLLSLHLIPRTWADGENFYDLLGVSREADTKTIRKAFKRIAILKHPDKNQVSLIGALSINLNIQDDPDAHSNFIRINRAYEVLKDEDLRKKYDERGEEGMENGGGSNQQ